MSRKGLSRIWVLEQCFNICRQGRRMCNRRAKRPLQLPLKILFMCDLARMIRILHYSVGVKKTIQQVILRPKHGWLCVERSAFCICLNDRHGSTDCLSLALVQRHGQWASENIRHILIQPKQRFHNIFKIAGIWFKQCALFYMERVCYFFTTSSFGTRKPDSYCAIRLAAPSVKPTSSPNSRCFMWRCRRTRLIFSFVVIVNRIWFTIQRMRCKSESVLIHLQ